MYFNDLVHWLCKSEAAAIIGAAGCWLLTVIARKEHELRYSRAPVFWNSELMTRCGFSSVETLIAARQKLVTAGLLHYVHGRKGAAGVYWCLWVDDSVGDSLGMQSGFPRNEVGNSDGITDRKPRETSNLSIPIPVPSPIPKKSKRSTFKRPTLDEVTAYCRERRNSVDPQRFIDFYTTKGWKVGGDPMCDWQACVRTWEGNINDRNTHRSAPETRVHTNEGAAAFAALSPT